MRRAYIFKRLGQSMAIYWNPTIPHSNSYPNVQYGKGMGMQDV